MGEAALAAWQSHLSINATLAATLLGLMFVAASINVKRIVAAPALPGPVVEALVQFTRVLFIAMVTIFCYFAEIVNSWVFLSRVGNRAYARLAARGEQSDD